MPTHSDGPPSRAVDVAVAVAVAWPHAAQSPQPWVSSVGHPGLANPDPEGGHPTRWHESTDQAGSPLDSRPASASACCSCSSSGPAHPSPSRSTCPPLSSSSSSSLLSSLSGPPEEETRPRPAQRGPMSLAPESTDSAWHGRAASTVSVAVEPSGSGQTSPAYSQYTTPARYPAHGPNAGLSRVVAASVLNAPSGAIVDGGHDAPFESSPMDPLTSSADDLGLQIGFTSRNSPTLLPQRSPRTSTDATLCGPRPQKIAWVIVVLLLLWGSFILGCHLQKRISGLEHQVNSLTQDLQELQIQQIRNLEEFSRQLQQMQLRLTHNQSSKPSKLKGIHSPTRPSMSSSLNDSGSKIAPTTISSSPPLPEATISHGDFQTKTESFFENIFGKGVSSRPSSPSRILPCSTESDIPCVFPFNYQGQNHTKCLKSLLPGKTWCAIEIQPDGTFIQQPDTWDYCQADCA